jgi:type IV pilus assembly protein PilQ
MSFEQAFNILSTISDRTEGKTIIDPLRRGGQINVEIKNLPWKKALEVILLANRLSYIEHEKFYEITGEQKPVKPEEEPIKLTSREIRIDAVFFEANRQALLDVGVNWSALFFGGNWDTTGFALNGADEVLDDIVEGRGSYSNSVDNYSYTVTGLVHALERDELGRVLAQPQLTVLSGKEGRIQVGQDFSIKTLDFAGNIVEQFFSVGTILTVKPTVYTENETDFIHLDIHMERSDVQPDPITTIVNKSQANTQVLLLDGETTVVGGLYSRDEGSLRKGVPFLKDLPWWVFGLRYIFGYNMNETYDRELVVVLRAHLLPLLGDRTDSVPSYIPDKFKQGSQDMRDRFEQNWDANQDTTKTQ